MSARFQRQACSGYDARAVLPNPQRAVIDPAKLRDYLLSTTHPVGRFKAAFFTSLGYEATAWKRLESDLRSQLLSQPALELEGSSYGRKFATRARLSEPSGKADEMVASVRIVLAAEDFPRFVTAYPESTR
jgi:hypothetical protein